MSIVMEFLYQLRRTLLRRLRWRTRGVKVMLFNRAGELLLIRNSYGRTDVFTLPGGGIGMFETPTAAALREVREEVGVTAEKLTLRSTHFSEAEGKRDTVHLFTAYAASEPKADSVEVEEVRFFALDRLPVAISPAALRRIAEYRGERPVEPRW
jgi:8-oxo-dGTP pyrophosphatase MutT (NUDIX family)